MLPVDEPFTIGRVRIRGAALDPSTIPRIGATIEALDLRPPGFRESTILVIRHLEDPMPGTLSVRPSSGTRAWEHAARERIRALERGAARPAAGPVREDVEAVAFADEGELLAAYAIDALQGTAATRWWWRAAIGSRAVASGGLAHLFVTRARSVPAAMAHLAARHRATDVARSFAPREAWAIVQAICQAFDLRDVLIRLEALVEEAARGRGVAADRAPTSRPDRSTVMRSNEPSGRIEPGSAPESADDARDRAEPSVANAGDPGWEQLVLVELAIAVARSPASPRQATFLDRWRGSRPARDEPADEVGFVATGSPIDGRGAPRAFEGGVVAMPVGQGIPGEPAADHGPAEHAPAEHESTARRRHAPSIQSRAAPIDPVPGGSESGPAWVPKRASTGRRADPAAELESRPEVRVADPGAPDAAVGQGSMFASPGIRTELCGIVYLVNLMAYLDLPEAFEPDWRLASSVGAWGVLELLARGLLGSAFARTEDDELWPALADLQGRTDPVLGGDLPADVPYRIPIEWIARDRPTPADIRWSLDRRRLRIWTGHGYLIADEPAPASHPEAAVRSTLEAVGLSTARVIRVRPSAGRFDRGLDALVRECSPGALAWLEAVGPYARRRLALALGRPRFTRLDALRLLARPGHLFVTATHVDAVMGLDAVSVAARTAGLDRDPGWLPAFGRVVKVHFE